MKRDTGVFVLLTLVFSVVLSGLFWVLPRIAYNPSDALILIPATSAILAARGARWRRRLVFAGLSLGGFLLVDYVFLRSGLMRSSFAGLAQAEPGWSTLAVAYLFFAQGLPFVVTLLFVGDTPSILWTKVDNDAAAPARGPRRSKAGGHK